MKKRFGNILAATIAIIAFCLFGNVTAASAATGPVLPTPAQNTILMYNWYLYEDSYGPAAGNDAALPKESVYHGGIATCYWLSHGITYDAAAQLISKAYSITLGSAQGVVKGAVNVLCKQQNLGVGYQTYFDKNVTYFINNTKAGGGIVFKGTYPAVDSFGWFLKYTCNYWLYHGTTNIDIFILNNRNNLTLMGGSADRTVARLLLQYAVPACSIGASYIA